MQYHIIQYPLWSPLGISSQTQWCMNTQASIKSHTQQTEKKTQYRIWHHIALIIIFIIALIITALLHKRCITLYNNSMALRKLKIIAQATTGVVEKNGFTWESRFSFSKIQNRFTNPKNEFLVMLFLIWLLNVWWNDEYLRRSWVDQLDTTWTCNWITENWKTVKTFLSKGFYLCESSINKCCFSSRVCLCMLTF